VRCWNICLTGRILKMRKILITFFAHGTTTDNEEGISSGWSDVELSELGVQQSKDLADLVKDMKFDAVFTSDQSRAVNSARLTWGEQYPSFQDKRLRECNYGSYNAKPSSEVEPLQEKSITTPMPNGESYDDVKVRMADFLEDIKKDYTGKHIAIVAHKAPQLALDVLLKNISWEEAFAKDWRRKKAWQPGWKYEI